KRAPRFSSVALNAIRLEKDVDARLDRGFDVFAADRFDDAKQEPLIDVALAEIDELPGGALRIGDLQRARLLQIFKLGCQAGGAIEWAGLIERSADIGKFFRRGDNHARESARSRLGHATDQPDAKILEHVSRVALTPEGAEAFGGLRKFAANDSL